MKNCNYQAKVKPSFFEIGRVKVNRNSKIANDAENMIDWHCKERNMAIAIAILFYFFAIKISYYQRAKIWKGESERVKNIFEPERKKEWILYKQ